MTEKVVYLRDYKRKEEKPKPEEPLVLIPCDTDTDGTAWPPTDMLAPSE